MSCSLPGSSVHGIIWQECWSGLPCSPPGDLLNPGIKPTSLITPSLADEFFITTASWEAHIVLYCKRFLIPFTQITHKKQTHKNKTFLILHAIPWKVQWYSVTAGIQGLASSEQAGWVSDCRWEKGWEMEELKSRQQEQTEGKLHFHSCPMLMNQLLVPCWIQFYLLTYVIGHENAHSHLRKFET